jgi:hypothetical protein
MRLVFSVLLVAILGISAHAQTCNCPAGGRKPNATFIFSNGKSIGVCGYVERHKKDTVYSEFTLYECSGKTIKKWGTDAPCAIQKYNDTLIVGELSNLPVGKGFSVKSEAFYQYKFYYQNGVLSQLNSFREDIRKYTDAEIKTAIGEYKKLTKDNSDKVIDVAELLFWSLVSGSKEAENDFRQINTKFGPFEGANAAWWNNIWSTYQRYKKSQKK